MQIKIIATEVTTKMNAKNKPMQVLEVTYKNLTFQGKTETKKLFDFGAQKDVFPVLSTATSGQVFEVDVVKNDAGYNDWVKISKADENVAAAPVSGNTTSRATASPAGTGTASKGTWETPEERAKKQIYIVRQSSINAAIAMLTVGKKTEIKTEDVIGVAREFEAFVFSTDSVEAVAGQDLLDIPGFEDLKSDDIPY